MPGTRRGQKFCVLSLASVTLLFIGWERCVGQSTSGPQTKPEKKTTSPPSGTKNAPGRAPRPGDHPSRAGAAIRVASTWAGALRM